MKRKISIIMLLIIAGVTVFHTDAQAFSIGSVIDSFFSSEIKGREAAGEEMKKQLLKRESELNVTYNVDDLNIFLVEKEFADVYRYAIAESEKPSEGDYLYAVGNVESEEDATINYYKQKDGTYNVKISVHMDYFTTKEEEKELEKKVEEIMDSLDIENASEYEKVRKIYNYICSNVTYDYKHLEDDSYMKKYTAYAAVFDHTAVCSGVAKLFYYMAKSAGLDVRCKTNNNHIWNFVKVDGKYYYLDATWDLGKKEKDYKYFLKGSLDYENHQGNVTISIFGEDYLKTSDANYDIAMYEYGSSK